MKSLRLILLTSLLSAGPAMSGNVEYKGFDAICQDAACSNVTRVAINQHATAAPAATQPPATLLEQEIRTVIRAPAGLPPADIHAEFRWSPDRGNGRSYALTNGSQLHSGDEFTIRLSTRKPAYLYVMQFDSHGQLQELVSLAGQSNRFKAGETRDLPVFGSHFTLDDHPGVETFHFLVSDHPLDDLMTRYRQGRLGNETLARAETKGIFIEADTQPKASPAALLACPPQGPWCRYSFHIQHLP